MWNKSPIEGINDLVGGRHTTSNACNYMYFPCFSQYFPIFPSIFFLSFFLSFFLYLFLIKVIFIQVALSIIAVLFSLEGLQRNSWLLSFEPHLHIYIYVIIKKNQQFHLIWKFVWPDAVLIPCRNLPPDINCSTNDMV